jgi:hypothetical protein
MPIAIGALDLGIDSNILTGKNRTNQWIYFYIYRYFMYLISAKFNV